VSKIVMFHHEEARPRMPLRSLQTAKFVPAKHYKLVVASYENMVIQLELDSQMQQNVVNTTLHAIAI
jgi:hypothetical protein